MGIYGVAESTVALPSTSLGFECRCDFLQQTYDNNYYRLTNNLMSLVKVYVRSSTWDIFLMAVTSLIKMI